MASLLTTASVAILVVYVLLRLLINVTQDKEEPPVISVGVPFLGPVISMLREKMTFFTRLRDKYRLPIYTLRMPFMRIYVLNATELIAPMHRQWRTVSFAAITVQATKAVGMSQMATDLMNEGIMDDDGFVLSMHRQVYQPMSPGPELDAMNTNAVKVLSADIDALRAETPRKIGLWTWARRAIFLATMEATYGPQNPYRDPDIAAAWLVFEMGFANLTNSPFPGFFAPALYKSRETVAGALIRYIKDGGWKSASSLVRARYEHHSSRGLSEEDMGRGELANSFAVVGNTAVCAWWVAYHVFSDPQVLADVRKEIETLIIKPNEADGDDTMHTFDLSNVRDACPILLSTLQETMRFRACSNSVRMILEDADIGGYRVKKGNMLMIPTAVQHTSAAAFGPDCTVFDHRRFVPSQHRHRSDSGSGSKKLNRVAFRAFGGGHVLCPGRHFASTEIMAFVALLALQFDIEPTAGRWIEPKCEGTPVTSGFPVPDHDIEVEMRRRDERQWRVVFSGTGKGVDIVSEDVDEQKE